MLNTLRESVEMLTDCLGATVLRVDPHRLVLCLGSGSFPVRSLGAAGLVSVGVGGADFSSVP